MPKVVSIYERQKEFESEGLYIFDAKNQIMMCKFCNIRVDWHRRDSCVKHVQDSTKHRENKNKASESRASSKWQLSMCETLQNIKKIKSQKEELICDTVGTLMKANIPLEKLDDPDFKAWLNKYIPGAGDIPSADTCRAKYAPRVAEEKKNAIKALITGQQVAILCDETTDRKGRCVFIVLLRVLSCTVEQKIFVGGVKMLEHANATECSRVVLAVIQDFGISYDNVVALVTDSARYMTLCAQMCNVLCPAMVHVQCWAHKLNIVAGIWSSELQHLNTCVSNAKMLFLNTRKRKHRYVSFLKECYLNDESKTRNFPSPIMTRWNSWFKSALYIGEHVQDLVDFCKTVDEGGAAVHYFSALEKETVQIIIVSAAFLQDHGQKLIDSITTLEGSSYPYSYKLHSTVVDLINNFRLVGKGLFGTNTAAAISKIKSTVKQAGIKQILENTGSLCETKLSRLMLSDTGRVFAMNMGKLFDEKNIASNSEESGLQAAASIQLLKQLDSQVLLLGYMCLQSTIKEALNKGASVSVLETLLSMKRDHGQFVDACVKALWVPCSNVDSERAISSYGNILTDLRTNASPETLEMQLNVYFGSPCD